MIWKYIWYLSKREAWGNPEKINGLLLLLFDPITKYMGARFIVHYAFQGNHSATGQHPQGNAADGHFDFDFPFYEQIIKLEKILEGLQVDDRVGLGLYPAWNNPGFHLDVRGRKARWGWIGEYKKDGSKKYCSYEKAKRFAEVMMRNERK